MEICNPTTETIRLEFDSTPYTFEPGEVTSVGDEAGAHLMTAGRRCGLVAVRWGMEPRQVALEGLRNRLNWMRQQVGQHDQQNHMQAERKFPPIAETPDVKMFRLAIPEYEAKIVELEQALGIEDEKQARERLRTKLGTVSPDAIPQLEDMTLDQLRQLAQQRKVEINLNWGRNKLLKKLNEELRQTA